MTLDMTREFDQLVRDIQSRLCALFLKKTDYLPSNSAANEATDIPWSWIAVNIAETLSAYPTGLTDSALLSILEMKWEKAFVKRLKGFDKDFNTIQAVYDCNSSETFILAVKTKSWSYIAAANCYQIVVGDDSGPRELDIYMHPKFSQWICYPDDPHFFTDRMIRMICPPKANTPINSRHSEVTLSRRYRVALIPPTELLLIMLDKSDKQFVQKEFPDKIKTMHTQVIRLWLKVIHVEMAAQTMTSNAIGKENKLQKTEIFLVDMSSDCTPVVLTLYDHQTQLASIFKRNDYIGLHNPTLVKKPLRDDEIVFEYSSETVIFLMPEKEAQEAGLAKLNLTSMIVSESSHLDSESLKKELIERDEEGFMDCSKHLTRIHVHHLTYCMLNVTLMGKVIGLANNNPFYKNKGQAEQQRMDRYALRIADSTGTIDITLWEDAGRSSRKLRIGQYILLDNLVTSDPHMVNNKQIWYVNGSAVCGTRIFNISTLTCLLSSASFRSITPLWHAKETKVDHFQVEGIIVGWELYQKRNNKEQLILSDEYTQLSSNTLPKVDFLDYSLGDRITTLAHSSCLLPKSSRNELECKFCGSLIGNEVIHIFRPKPSMTDTSNENSSEAWIEWRLDDGTSNCKFYGGEETLLNITAHHFKLMSHQSQIRLLNSAIGMPIICSISGNGTSTYRLSQMSFVEPTQQECRDMIEMIENKTQHFPYIMKFSLLTAAAAVAVAQVSAVTVVTPWSTSTWTAGGHGNITWTITDAEANLKCDIYLLSGDAKNANIVAQITDPATPVACNALKYDIYPLNDFASGQYSIRIGQASTGTWSYSSAFSFTGNGSSKPICNQASASGSASGTVAAAAAAATSGAATSGAAASGSKAVASASGAKSAVSGSASASQAASTQTSGASSNTVSAAALAMGAVAAVALSL
ncbi:hypothetical protein A0J61_01156 [Choanephora cucurbitarum]|uniref:Cell division control protein 24 OB domain-containing protein n=1 Tax=Choanephora cucurbitarum TaxID=101091 RepID=A0A1C7NP98_9FUNG|nr:hypothetical protein A0J61_01156 [Choanephora cucurbitarum]